MQLGKRSGFHISVDRRIPGQMCVASRGRGCTSQRRTAAATNILRLLDVVSWRTGSKNWRGKITNCLPV